MRGNLIQIRVGDEEKVRIRGRATAAGFDSISEFLRELALGNVEPMVSSTAIPMPERKGQARGSDSSTAKEEPVLPKTPGAIPVDAGTTPGSLAAKVPPSVAAEIEESRLKDAAAREAFIGRRAQELHGTGYTTPVARRMAAQEWAER